MGNGENSGCRFAVWVVATLALVVFLIVGGCSLMIFKRTTSAQRSDTMAVEQAAERLDAPPPGTATARVEMLRLEEADWEALKMPEKGAPVSLKQFILIRRDPRATELLRETFATRTDGAPVRWELCLDDLKMKDGVQVASAYRSYQITRATGGDSFVAERGQLDVEVEFAHSGEDAFLLDELLKLRVGDPLTVEGRLAMDGGSVRITNAHLVEAR
jgi:hypothetical protein